MNTLTTSWVEERGISDDEMEEQYRDSLIGDIISLSTEVERVRAEFHEFTYSDATLGDPNRDSSLLLLMENQINELRRLIYIKAQELSE